MLKFSVFLVGLIACLSSYAFDPTDYSITMANDALSSKQPNKALEIINESLEENPNNRDLLALKKKAQKLKKKMITQKAIKKKASVEKKSKEKEKRKRKWAASKKATEKQRIKERPELLKKTHCDCYATLVYNQKVISRQRQGANLTGIVNKRKLYEAGQGIIKLNATIAYLNKTMRAEGIKTGDCEKRKPAYAGWTGQFCMSYLSENRNEIEF